MSQLTEETWVADIVKAVPKTGDLFRKLRIDFCCGGKYRSVKQRPIKVSTLVNC